MVQYDWAGIGGGGVEFSFQNFRHFERQNTCRAEDNREQLSNEFRPNWKLETVVLLSYKND
jgi:hypothetical protein